MKENTLGINFDDMIDMSQMIETDAGEIVVENPAETEPPKEEVNKEADNLIEVDTEESAQEDNDSRTEESAVVDTEQSSSSSLPDLKVLANALYEQGVLSELDTEKLASAEGSDAEMLIDLIKGEITNNVNSYKEGLPNVIKNLIDNYEDNVPLDKLIGLKSESIRLDNITSENLKGNTELQKKVISENYKRLGMSDAKIAKRIQQFEDLDQLTEESEDALSDSKEFMKEAIEAEKEAARINTENAEKARQKNLTSLKDKINSTDTLVGDIKLTKKEKESLYNSMTKVVETDDNGTPMNTVMVTRAKNPLGFEQLLHYYHSIGLFNIGDDGKIQPDISKIKTGAKASMMDELSSALRKGQSLSSGKPAGEQHFDRTRLKSNIDSMRGIVK